MEKYYRFGGVELMLDLPVERMDGDEKKLEPFAVGSVDDPYIYRFCIVPELTAPRGELVMQNAASRLYRDGDTTMRYTDLVGNGRECSTYCIITCGRTCRVELPDCGYTRQIGVPFVLDCLDILHLAAEAGGFAFHCSYVEHQGKAILFTAPCGTGKTTQAELWRQYRSARIVNGDRAVIRWDGERLLAEGIPYCGSSTYCENASLPIGAVVYLAQAPVTSIRRLRGFEAFSRLWEGVNVHTWDRKDMEQASDVVQRLASQIPIYYMPCTPDESAVIALEQAMESW